MRALIPAVARARAVRTEVEVVRAPSAHQAIAQTAARLDVDAVCMATHGRTGLVQAALGSQAQEVLQRVRQPVVLVPPERARPFG